MKRPTYRIDRNNGSPRFADPHKFLDPNPRLSDVLHNIRCDYNVSRARFDWVNIFAYSPIGQPRCGWIVLDSDCVPTNRIVCYGLLEGRPWPIGTHFNNRGV
jgi:hypothetical protein